MGNTPLKALWLKITARLLGLILLLTALFFIIEGGKLLSLGGSGYFLISGIFLLVSSIQLFRLRASGAVRYLLFALGTLVWAVMEVGIVFWPLISRMMFPAGLAIIAFVILPSLRQPAPTRGNANCKYRQLCSRLSDDSGFRGCVCRHVSTS
ncbi:quinate dehydrogenase (quinone) [Rosenbergiella nectarea]|uniref:Quinate dehydrogenase (Quinone) n=1 Tax=Rosenbergiella nectarea TaxID=988801 RepID=A0A1H9JRR3_9GAMM|nr:quinate dehydrogenase (quinone) [Rosenbergiella nectarea]